MKKVYYLLLALAVCAACKKNNIKIDNGCISQIKKQRSGISKTDSATAAQLLLQNKIPYNNLVFNAYLSNILPVNGITHTYQHISAREYFNGFPILSYDFGYSFKDGIFQEITGAKYNAVNLDTQTKLTLPELRKLYLNLVNKSSKNAGRFKDSCLVALPGYYDLNYDINKNDTSNPNFIKVWSVTPKNSDHPVGIFRDDNGQTVLYSEGFVLSDY